MNQIKKKFKIKIKNATEITAIEKSYNLNQLILGFWSISEIILLKLNDEISKTCEDDIEKLEGHDKGISCLKYFESKRILISGGFDCHIIVWNLEGRSKIIKFKAHNHYICSIQMESNGEFFYTISKDNTIKEWNTKTGRQSEKFTKYFSNTCNDSFTLSPCEKFIAACNFKKSYKVDMFNILTKRLFCDFDDHKKLSQNTSSIGNLDK